MPKRKAVHPELYAPGPDDNPELNGGKCRACGYVFFPPQRYGCESCGAPPEQLEAVKLAGRGILYSYATVNLYQGKDIEAPFTVGVVVLDDGPAVRSVLANSAEAGLAIGDRMKSVMVTTGANQEGDEMVELRFARTEERQ